MVYLFHLIFRQILGENVSIFYDYINHYGQYKVILQVEKSIVHTGYAIGLAIYRGRYLSFSYSLATFR